jgi:hypothetical protein
MDGLNRLRFASDPESLAAWASASSIAAAASVANGEQCISAGGASADRR